MTLLFPTILFKHRSKSAAIFASVIVSSGAMKNEGVGYCFTQIY